MKEKILAVLVVVSLILSVLNLVLTLRTNSTQITLDLETIRADSFELKLRGEFSISKFPSSDNETYWNELMNAPHIEHVNETTFLSLIKQYGVGDYYPYRVKNTFVTVDRTYHYYLYTP